MLLLIKSLVLSSYENINSFCGILIIRQMQRSIILLSFCLSFTAAWSQDKPKKNTFGEGIRVLNADSTFSMKFGVRIQSLYQGDLNLESDEYVDGFQIRRSRLKFDG